MAGLCPAILFELLAQLRNQRPTTMCFRPSPRFPGTQMQNVLIIIQLIVSIALIGTVLLQRSEGGALGMGGGGSGLGGLFSPRGAADTLTRTTAILAAAFFATSLALTLFALHGRPQSRSILDQQIAPGATRPVIPLKRPAPQPAKRDVPQLPTPH